MVKAPATREPGSAAYYAWRAARKAAPRGIAPADRLAAAKAELDAAWADFPTGWSKAPWTDDTFARLRRIDHARWEAGLAAKAARRAAR